jgi:phosphoadenylyl-sulfate reductase (thioredoxin)
VLPLRAELARLDAWVTAIRRDQTPDRANARVVEWDAKFGLVKVNPLAAWTSRDVWAHARAHGVPTNPLHEQGYTSIGCAPCTTPVLAGEDQRAGRWRGRAKTECGLHARPARKGEQR